MTTVGTLARSKVARRIVALFVVCAMLPVVGLAAVVYVQFTTELREKGQQRLHQVSKAVGMDLLDRLRSLDAELGVVGALLPSSTSGAIPGDFRERLVEHFSSVTLIDNEGRARAVAGSLPAAASGAADAVVMEAGESQLLVEPRAGAAPRVVLRRKTARGAGTVEAELRTAFLWGGDLVPPTAEVHVLGADQLPLFASASPEKPVVPATMKALVASSVGGFEWERSGKSYLSAYWSVPLESSFRTPQWTVVVSESRSQVLAAVNRAGRMFILVGLLSLWIVMLLSLVQIRRSLVPLGQLQEGTQRLTSGDFDRDVEVTSGDEFEDLADSFNTMSHRLKRQFEMLSARGDLDRAVLSSLDVGTIIRSLLARLPSLVDCDHVAVILTASNHSEARLFWQSRSQSAPAEAATPTFSPDEERAVREIPDMLLVERTEKVPTYLSSIGTTEWAVCLVLPIAHGGNVAGLLVLADAAPRRRLVQDRQIARQLADQLTVALSNARLLEALDRLNVGTLTALARTVDAKSPWTAGHSQRVTEMALDIGRAMGLSASRLDTIARGALLHDIGKIAVPSAILNKPGKLSAEEFETMKTHPVVGARILEPITEYRHLIPIVVQHHERFDGKGYPHGLAGEAIALEARIVAVADVFDALSSERPYRRAMAFDRAIDLIVGGSGTAFDPEVVKAFLRLKQPARAPRVA